MQSQSPIILLNKFFSIGSKPSPETFPELPICVLWLRFVLAIAFALYLTSSPTAGVVSILFGLNIVTFTPLLFCKMLLLADMDAWENKLTFTGVPNAVGLLLLVWVYCFTNQHEEEEAKFITTMIAQQAIQQVATFDDSVLSSEDILAGKSSNDMFDQAETHSEF
mmetsp:Transcript_6373/g.9386  ORF Transcript_6373/g.9386 Transcript_6373/m.9386 type:complete len:165 (-) Transcript_6373:122-616(-)|eukprot:CAMPEP_0194199110 /NCGR_PEP_ID=MMETSP0156-20130528/253_1 /TAXON_ID=33649 /ORGANISM="Thalassionema nitzschioides, Strain L26-B" /LENGTH=164 /DNA_ID=CAMNT_0038923959 /DNA_START=82 /DNA_END=576 /DNA_ORIENTATION=+